jgi:hypothetical protein
MEIRFTNQWTMTKDLFYEYRKEFFHVIPFARRMTIGLFAVFWAVVGFAYLDRMVILSVILFIFSIFCIISVFKGYLWTAWMEYINLHAAHRGDPHFEIRFFEDHIENDTQNSKNTIFYEKITKILQTKRLIILIVTFLQTVKPGKAKAFSPVTSAIVLLKEAFNEKELADFKFFIKQKCPIIEDIY